jgi:hypothetical protein
MESKPALSKNSAKVKNDNRDEKPHIDPSFLMARMNNTQRYN